MIHPPLPPNEAARLRALASYYILDTCPEEPYETLTRQAADLCGTPIAFLALVDEQRKWCKAVHGLPVKVVPRELSFAAYAILDPTQVLEVPNARYHECYHDRFLTTGPARVIYYAAAPIVDPDGYALGALAVADQRPRYLPDAKLVMLQTLAGLVSTHLELRRRDLSDSDDKISGLLN